METPPPQDPQDQPAPSATPPQQTAQPHYQPQSGPTIRFDVIGQAFNIVFADLATWAVAGLCVFAAIAVIYIVFGMLLFASLLHGSFLAMLFGVAILAFAIITVVNVMMSNMYRMAIMAVSGTKPSVNEMFKFGPQSPNIVVASLLVGLATAVGSMFCYIPGLVLAGLFMFTIPIVVDRNMGATDAMTLSLNTLKKDAAMATIFYLVLSFCAGLGSILVGIGVVITMPIIPIAIALLYRDYLGFESKIPDPA